MRQYSSSLTVSVPDSGCDRHGAFAISEAHLKGTEKVAEAHQGKCHKAISFRTISQLQHGQIVEAGGNCGDRCSPSSDRHSYNAC